MSRTRGTSRLLELGSVAALALLALAPFLGGVGVDTSRPATPPGARAEAEVFALLERHFLLAGLPGIVILQVDGPGRTRVRALDAAAVSVPIAAPRPARHCRRLAPVVASAPAPLGARVHASRGPPARPA